MQKRYVLFYKGKFISDIYATANPEYFAIKCLMTRYPNQLRLIDQSKIELFELGAAIPVKFNVD